METGELLVPALLVEGIDVPPPLPRAAGRGIRDIVSVSLSRSTEFFGAA